MRQKRSAWLVVVTVATCLSPLIASAQNDFLGLQKRLIELFQENEGSVVRVKAAYEAEGDDDIPQLVIGTGFFISREGHVLTNASIVRNPLRVWIEHDRVDYAAELIGIDEAANVALLRVNTLPDDFNFLYLIDSPELPPIGTVVVRISMPLEFEPTPDMGLVSGFESRFGERFFPCNYIRTSILAGPGDGGSAYLDLKGRLIGIQVGSLPEVNSTYVLPARAALRIRDDLLFSGEVKYGWIGFEVREEASVQFGSRIVLAVVMEGTPAREAGLLPGDVLTSIGDYTVRSIDDLRNAMFYTRVGQYVTVRVIREGEAREFSVRLGERPASEPLEVLTPLNIEQDSGSDAPIQQSQRRGKLEEHPLIPKPSMVPEDSADARTNVPLKQPG